MKRPPWMSRGEVRISDLATKPGVFAFFTIPRSMRSIVDGVKP